MDELGKSFSAAEGLVDAEQGAAKKTVNENCLNCGTKLQDIFCHHCGQKDIPKRQTLRELIENFIGSFYSFESKFFRTVRYLLFKPGFLPVEYTAGRRESYYHPARAYVFISFVFFLLLFSLPDEEDKEDNGSFNEEDKKELDESLKVMRDQLKLSGLDSATVDSIYHASNQLADTTDVVYTFNGKKQIKKKGEESSGINFSDIDYNTVVQYDSAQQTLPESERDGWFLRKVNIRAIELSAKYTGDNAGKRLGEDFTNAFKENFSKILFYLLPIFALLLKLLYVRRDFYYSEHLVFSIYFYNFFYLAAILSLLLSYIPFLGGLFTALIACWILAYLPIAMKRMYKQNWRKTIFKYVLFFFSFMTCLSIGLIINALFILSYL